MRQITSAELKGKIEHDPAWASKLTEPVEITDYCDMVGATVTHLSPLLHFSGKNGIGWSADFFGCKFLRKAEGKFIAGVKFWESGIEKIGDLSCGKDKNGWSADFSYCKSLVVGEGNFPGFVNFWGSGIKKIGDLSCGVNGAGDSADFNYCKSLKIAEKKFQGFVSFRESSIETIGDLSCGKNKLGIRLNVQGCHNLKFIPSTFNPNEIEADPKLIKNLTGTRAYIQKKREEIVEIEI